MSMNTCIGFSMSLQVSGFGTYGKVVIAAPLEGSDEPRQAVALEFPRSWRRETLGFDRLEVMKEADLLCTWETRRSAPARF